MVFTERNGSILQTIRNYFDELKSEKPDLNEKTFASHNRRIWRKKLFKKTDGELLVELIEPATSIISLSYFSNVLASKLNAKLLAYHIRKPGIYNRIKFRRIENIFRSFNTKIIPLYFSSKQRAEADELLKTILPTLKNKKDVENLTVNGIWLGDLLYDSHLKRKKEPTIDLKDPKFHGSLRKTLLYYILWRDYFDTHKVKAVLLSHCVYNLAIILRVAIERNIPCYQVNAVNIYLINQNNAKRYNYRAYTDFIDFRKNFNKLPMKDKEKGLKLAKERIERRFSGEIGVDMIYSTKSAYTKERYGKRLLRSSSRIKILVAAHCFFDSPHPFGNNLFPDFYEWFECLGKISEASDYDWYIKTHPDFLPGNMQIIEQFIRKYPKFVLLPPEASHFQIIEEGINFALTVYGTIAFEYAALGMPVITASLNNQTIAYRFNIHPKNISEYKNILMNLSNQSVEINEEEIYEFYFMRYINNSENWLFTEFNKFLREVGGYKEQFSSIAYRKFLDEFSEEKHFKIFSTLNKFILSKDYCLNRNHIQQ